ncbi:unnamed protein product [Brachionus calyciflorus]|uniref:Uncharacterized protein n=1 Tax=Brachionus calyciflorus TaxID=104777 RepID=A0A814ALE7_9BILA|nr:unnamed protein product [Brachionus calyciflorus]
MEIVISRKLLESLKLEDLNDILSGLMEKLSSDKPNGRDESEGRRNEYEEEIILMEQYQILDLTEYDSRILAIHLEGIRRLKECNFLSEEEKKWNIDLFLTKLYQANNLKSPENALKIDQSIVLGPEKPLEKRTDQTDPKENELKQKKHSTFFKCKDKSEEHNDIPGEKTSDSSKLFILAFWSKI